MILSYQDIDLPGESFDRGGDGPLGLVLGLDLRGGTHLIYQAERPVNIDITFGESHSESDIREAFKGIGFDTLNISLFDQKEFSISVPGLKPAEIDSFIEGLESELGELVDYGHKNEYRTRLQLKVVDLPNVETVEAVLTNLGYKGVEVASLQEQIFTVKGMPYLDQDAETDLENALGELYKLDDLFLASEDDSDEVQSLIFFEGFPDEGIVRDVLDSLDYKGSTVISHGGNNIVAIIKMVDASEHSQLENDVQGEIVGIQAVEAMNVDTALMDLVFAESEEQTEVETVLVYLGHPESIVTESRATGYGIDIPSITDEKSLTLETELTQILGTVGQIQIQREEPTPERMDGVVDTIQRRVDAFGITEPVIQRFGEDRVLVQMPGAGDTNIEVVFQDSVAEVQLQEGLSTIGLDQAKIVRLNDQPVVNGVLMGIPGLSEDSSEEIRVGLGDLVGELREYSFNPSTGRIRTVYLESVDLDKIKSVMGDLGYDDVSYTQPLGSSFRIRIPSLRADEQGELKSKLAFNVHAVQSFELSGGVEEAKALIGQTAQLVIKERTCLNSDCSQFSDRESVGRSGESLTGSNLSSAYPSTHPTTGLPIVNFVFDNTGTRIFRELTAGIAGNNAKCIAYILDGETIICPIARQAIIGGAGYIEGDNITFDSARTLSIQLESGSLPVSLDLVRESTVDSLLGNESLKASLKAGLVGLGLILLFMIAYYRIPGLIAASSLMIYAAILLALFKMLPVTLTMSGLAGLILSIGMAVDANILIFERLKEELRTGRSLMSSIDIGFRRSWTAIRDSNISTFITCGILFYFGRELGEPRITGFAIVLFLGVGLSMFTALNVSRTLLHLVAFAWGSRGSGMFTPEGRRASSNVDRGGM
tara:strand:- start:1037 stop:3673 length:2637 start_codon:yes stop_codon:yes gene_type:complete